MLDFSGCKYTNMNAKAHAFEFKADDFIIKR